VGLPAVPPAGLVLTGIVSVQVGAGLATRLFSQASPDTVTGVRLWVAAAVLALIAARPAARTVAAIIRERAWTDAAVAIGFGLALAGMNFSIYQAMDRIPLGIAVTIEFLGPLAVAVAASRRAIDLAWVALAGTGVALLSGDSPRGGLALAGVGFALLAGVGWAAYILLSAATGRRFGGSSGLAIAMVVAAVAVTPPAVATAGTALSRPAVWITGAGVGLLSSVIPYRLELEALRRVPAQVFGIWMSLEPAVAALVGLVLLSQSLAAAQWVAVGCVMVACAGAARGRRPDGLPPPPGG
jgi:inner membrane transporter RhtA